MKTAGNPTSLHGPAAAAACTACTRRSSSPKHSAYRQAELILATSICESTTTMDAERPNPSTEENGDIRSAAHPPVSPRTVEGSDRKTVVGDRQRHREGNLNLRSYSMLCCVLLRRSSLLLTLKSAALTRGRCSIVTSRQPLRHAAAVKLRGSLPRRSEAESASGSRLGVP